MAQMRRALLLAALLTLAAWPAAAQPRPAERMFISPSGEPFRGPDGLARWFAGADADHDGRLTPEEFVADGTRLFTKLDANHDGKIDGFEEGAYERDLVPEITGLFFGGGGEEGGPDRPRFGFRRGGRGGGREGAGRYGLLDIPQPVSGADRDVDGKITLDEWRRTLAMRFGMLDVAKAGVLTLETLPPLPGAPGKGKPPRGRRRAPG